MRYLTYLTPCFVIGLCVFSHQSIAANMLEYLTTDHKHVDADRYTGPTVEDLVADMDTDKNGFADVLEVRAYLEKIHGKGYQQALLDKLEASARGQSCSTPFAKELYTDEKMH